MKNLFRLIWNFFTNFIPKSYQIEPIPIQIPPQEFIPGIQPPQLPPKYLWDNYINSVQSVRNICVEQGLSPSQRQIICACIEQESQFNNKAKNENKNSQRVVTSTDWGLCQINDRFHIGQGKDFPNVQYVLDNPDKAVLWMIQMFKAGKLNLWVSFSSGAYKKWLFLF